MKKFLSLALCLAVLLSCAMIFSACTGGDDPKETQPDNPSKTEAPTEEATEAPTEEATEVPTEAPTEEGTEATDPGEDGTTDGSGDVGDYDPEYYVVINSAEDLMAFNKAVNEDGEVYFDMTIVLTADIDLTGYEWKPLDGYAFDFTTFDGNGHTISNMEIVHDVEPGTPAEQIGAGFIGVAVSDITFEDITFENCRITLSKSSKWQCGLYDLRPCLDWGVEKQDNSAFFIRYAKNITIMKTKTAWGTICESYAHAIDAGEVENLELVRFEGKAARGAEDIKTNNVRMVR